MIGKEEYQELVKKSAPKTKNCRTLFTAFLVGGLICVIGQGIGDILKLTINNITDKDVASATSIILIFLGSFLTGIGVYDKIGHFAGAGSIVPITGFANSIVSPAMEFNREGIVFGVCSKMFTIAGPIIVFGVVSSVLIGVVALIVGSI